MKNYKELDLSRLGFLYKRDTTGFCINPPTFSHLDMLGLAHLWTNIVCHRKVYEGETLLTLVDCDSLSMPLCLKDTSQKN